MRFFSEFWTSPKVENRSKRHFAKFLPLPDFAIFSPDQRYRATGTFLGPSEVECSLSEWLRRNQLRRNNQ